MRREWAVLRHWSQSAEQLLGGELARELFKRQYIHAKSFVDKHRGAISFLVSQQRASPTNILELLLLCLGLHQLLR